jgi:hypothetical protein
MSDTSSWRPFSWSPRRSCASSVVVAFAVCWPLHWRHKVSLVLQHCWDRIPCSWCRCSCWRVSWAGKQPRWHAEMCQCLRSDRCTTWDCRRAVSSPRIVGMTLLWLRYCRGIVETRNNNLPYRSSRYHSSHPTGHSWCSVTLDCEDAMMLNSWLHKPDGFSENHRKPAGVLFIFWFFMNFAKTEKCLKTRGNSKSFDGKIFQTSNICIGKF